MSAPRLRSSVSAAQAGAVDDPVANGRSAAGRPSSAWTFLTNHSHVLLCLAADPDARLRDVAERVGITERAVQQIVGDLERGGVLTRERVGRRNRYAVDPNTRLRHPVEAAHTVRELLALGPVAARQFGP